MKQPFLWRSVRQATGWNWLAIRRRVVEYEADAVESHRQRIVPVAERQMTTGSILRAAVFAFIAVLVFSPSILAIKTIDYQRRLNPQFSRRIRQETRFIILHSTESRLPSALRTLSRGKMRGGRYVTRGGHAHYLIARNGAVYRILDHKYWANHAGVSMWNGLEELSDYSVGIELEGYHNVPFAEAQYLSLRKLLDELQDKYEIEDRNVLEHYRVAYASPNRYHSTRQRGRKLDPGADNFSRAKAGLDNEYSADPDVIAGRINGSPRLMRAGGHAVPAADVGEDEGEETDARPAEQNSEQISRTRTAWQIAGVRYSAPTTVYQFPDGRSYSGDQIKDWSDLPAGTRVQLGAPLQEEKKVVSALRLEVVVPEVSSVNSPWKIANALYSSSITFYVLPDGRVHAGNTIKKMASIPSGTKVLVAYRELPKPETGNAIGEDLRDIYLAPRTLYLFPGRTLRSGDQIDDFTKLPAGIRVFAKVE
ncbi:MAG: N-acetylmuramoyl-L-alanine amidase [Acidobacteria bacterium]|nr:N-acetylmuramoyl-L-alanine amidase [Acidobacteriota bacterium]